MKSRVKARWCTRQRYLPAVLRTCGRELWWSVDRERTEAATSPRAGTVQSSPLETSNNSRLQKQKPKSTTRENDTSVVCRVFLHIQRKRKKEKPQSTIKENDTIIMCCVLLHIQKKKPRSVIRENDTSIMCGVFLQRSQDQPLEKMTPV